MALKQPVPSATLSKAFEISRAVTKDPPWSRSVVDHREVS